MTCILYEYWFKVQLRGFPGGSVVKNLLASAADMGSIPGLGEFHMPGSS